MDRLLQPFALIGRYGTQGFAASIFLGLALPQFAAAARPFLAVTIFVFTTLTFARVEAAAVKELARRPLPLVLACLWLVLAPPLAALAGLALVGRESLDPGLVLGLALLGAAPPIMSAPAVAMLLGLKPTLVVAAVLLTTSLAPLASPLVADLIAGAVVPLDTGILVRRLVLLIGGAVVAAIVLRLWLGEARIRANKGAFDGIGVVMYFVFAVAAMDGVPAAVMADPGRVARYLALAFALSGAGFLGAWLVLRALEPGDRFALGYGTGQRNMGLLVAALGAATPDTTFLFFALAQFPIYLMPQIVKPLAKRLRPQDSPV
ncbi:MAG TPA: Na+-dependent transporter [Beijerinckiaceae bacterium]|jgi:BASS family bile acid:Na+ symporter